MLAVLKRDEHSAISVERIRVPEPGPDEVLVRVKATAICGTDLHIAHWSGIAQSVGVRLPLVLGHEFSGEIAETGHNVRGLARGDYIAGETHIPCGECYQCLNGLQHICGRLKMFGIHRDGSFAEYTTIPALCARKIPTSIPPEIGAILEPLGTSLRAALELGVSGEVVAVTGCGPIGLLAIAAAKAMGAFRVVATDIRSDRLDLARRLGADVALDPTKTDVVAEVLALTHGVGVDAFIDASGSDKAIQLAFKCLRKGGKAALIGLPSTPVSLNVGVDVVLKEAKIVGIHGRVMYATWTHMENMLSNGKLVVDPVVTHEMSLADCAKGMALLEEGKGGKVVLVP
jgi:threonine 3-dehydrogenase